MCTLQLDNYFSGQIYFGSFFPQMHPLTLPSRNKHTTKTTTLHIPGLTSMAQDVTLPVPGLTSMAHISLTSSAPQSDQCPFKFHAL